MKRLSIALAAIGLSASIGAFAALPAATDPTVVNVPQLPGGFVVGVTGFYLQPSATNGDLDYAILNTGTSPNFNSEIKNIDPSYDWGWGVNVGYIFPNTGNDVNVSYFRLETSDTASLSGTNLDAVNPDIISLFSGEEIQSASAKASYDFKQVDATVGQFINVGCRLILHPNVGLRWAQVERDFEGFYNGAVSETPTTVDNLFTKEESDFNGVGPLLGLDASYYVMYGFGFVGHFDSAVLVGNIDSNINTTGFTKTATTAFTVTNANQFKVDNTTRVVPVVDMKLGADYTYVFNNTANSDLTLEVGWQFTNYFNAVDRVIGSGIGSGTNIAFHTTSDVGLNGPYVSLVFHA